MLFLEVRLLLAFVVLLTGRPGRLRLMVCNAMPAQHCAAQPILDAAEARHAITAKLTRPNCCRPLPQSPAYVGFSYSNTSRDARVGE